ncbi:MAG: malate synthase A [Anaerolineales bacterium]|nr:malate synthase A [Anaerolineales bacterium]
MTDLPLPPGVSLRGPELIEAVEVLTPDALAFIAQLQRTFNGRRLELLARREERQSALDAGQLPDFLAETQAIRAGDWQVGSIPADLQRRHIEITGPTDAKMVINALNSGADVFMSDFEDANSPTWANLIQGQLNLTAAIERTLSFSNEAGKAYRLNDRVALLLVRPRGWHLDEKHVWVDGAPISGSLFDFGLYFFRNAGRLLAKGSGPYFYLPKLESHLEARLWNDVFIEAQRLLGLPVGTIKVTVLVETILAAFEMDEILYELRDHIVGLNAGRWDYMFSVVKKFRNQPDFVFPDRAQVTMTAPFMRAYTELLVRTCHRRGAHAMGGMAAFIPSRKDAAVNEVAIARVREDKLREANDGFDGTWVAHPDLVPVAKAVFDEKLGDRPHQKERLREDVSVTAEQLRDFRIPDGRITEAGLRLNLNVGILYIESWLRGVGAAAIYNLMEDAATAEISRAQVWQWIHSSNGVLADGRKITLELYRQLLPEELDKIKALVGAEAYASGKFEVAWRLFDALVTQDTFEDFLTLGAYQRIA